MFNVWYLFNCNLLFFFCVAKHKTKPKKTNSPKHSFGDTIFDFRFWMNQRPYDCFYSSLFVSLIVINRNSSKSKPTKKKYYFFLRPQKRRELFFIFVFLVSFAICKSVQVFLLVFIDELVMKVRFRFSYTKHARICVCADRFLFFFFCVTLVYIYYISIAVSTFNCFRKLFFSCLLYRACFGSNF